MADITRQIAIDLVESGWSLVNDMEALPYEDVLTEAWILYADVVNNDHEELYKKVLSSDRKKLFFFRKMLIELSLYYKNIGLIRSLFIIHYNNDLALWKEILGGNLEYKITFLTAMYEFKDRGFMEFMKCIYNAFTPDMHAFVAEQHHRLSCQTLELHNDEDWSVFDDYATNNGCCLQ